jgi:hypothetical protein
LTIVAPGFRWGSAAFHEEVAVDVRAHDALQLLAGDVLKGLLYVLLGGVVDEHMQMSITLHRLLDGAPAKGFVADVALDGQALTALVLDQPLHFLRIRHFFEKDDRNVGAFAREQHRDGAADAAVAAGDQRDPAGKPGAAGEAARSPDAGA